MCMGFIYAKSAVGTDTGQPDVPRTPHHEREARVMGICEILVFMSTKSWKSLCSLEKSVMCVCVCVCVCVCHANQVALP